MAITAYNNESGSIVTLPMEGWPEDVREAAFSIVWDYSALYEEALPRLARLEKRNGTVTPYGLPSKHKPMRVYRGIDREPMEHTPEDLSDHSVEEVRQYFVTIRAETAAELLFLRVHGSEAPVPEGLTLLGYDAAWPYDNQYGDGFSAICDCLFLCRWHGCDEAGTEFLPEFQTLNENGLFDTAQEAERYLLHYLAQDWAETGDYLIYEVYAWESLLSD